MQTDSYKLIYPTEDITTLGDTLKPNTMKPIDTSDIQPAPVVTTDTTNEVVRILQAQNLDSMMILGDDSIRTYEETTQIDESEYQAQLHTSATSKNNIVTTAKPIDNSENVATGIGVLLACSIIMIWLSHRMSYGVNTRSIPNLSYPITITSLRLTGGDGLFCSTIVLSDNNDIIYTIKIGEEPSKEVENRTNNLEKYLRTKKGFTDKQLHIVGDVALINGPITVDESVLINESIEKRTRIT